MEQLPPSLNVVLVLPAPNMQCEFGDCSLTLGLSESMPLPVLSVLGVRTCTFICSQLSSPKAGCVVAHVTT